MSVKDDGQYYTEDSFYADLGEHFSDTEKGHKLPGNTQDLVHVESRLFVYLKTFQNFVKENPQVEYRNTARTGAKIEGVPYVDYKQALDWMSPCPDHDFDIRVEKLLLAQESCPDIEILLDPIKRHTNQLLNKSLRLAVEIELLPEKFSESHYSQNKRLTDILKSAGEVNAIVDSDPTLWSIIFEGKTKGELITYKRKIRDISSKNKTWDAIQRNKEYFWALSEGCHWLLSEVENLKERTTQLTF